MLDKMALQGYHIPKAVRDKAKSKEWSNGNLSFEDWIIFFKGANGVAGLNGIKASFTSFPLDRNRCLGSNMYRSRIRAMESDGDLASKDRDIVYGSIRANPHGGIGFNEYMRLSRTPELQGKQMRYPRSKKAGALTSGNAEAEFDEQWSLVDYRNEDAIDENQLDNILAYFSIGLAPERRKRYFKTTRITRIEYQTFVREYVLDELRRREKKSLDVSHII